MNFNICFLQLVFCAANFFEHIWSSSSSRRPLYCYYTYLDQNRVRAFRPKNVPEDLCTDVMMHITEIRTDNLLIDTIDGHVNNEWILKLRKKVKDTPLHAVVGDYHHQGRFKLITENETKMRKFAESVVKYLNKHKFDGLAIDWFRPGASQKSKLTKLCRILYDKLKSVTRKGRRKLKMIMMVNAWKPNVRLYYEPHFLHKYVDHLLLHSYGYSGTWKSVIGPNSPLYAGEGSWDGQDVSINEWVDAGAPRNKIVVGIPTYGRTFKMRSPSQFQLGRHFSGAGHKGSNTGNTNGYLAYYELCVYIKSFKRQYSEKHQVPFMYGKRYGHWEHIGYEDARSAQEKAKYIVDKGYAGAHFSNLAHDDYRNVCKGGEFPIINAVKRYFGDYQAKTNPVINETQNTWILDENTGKRYTIVSTEKSDKAFNAKKCRDNGGFLPEPRIYAENKFLNDMNTEMFFLGMTQSKVSGVWSWDSDKSPVLWFKWTPNDDDKPGEFCAVMLRNQNSRGQTLDSYWSDVKCASDSWLNGKKKSLICQKNENNWFTDKKSGKQYVVMFTEDLKHDANQQICNSIGGFLPEPKNKDENDFLNSLGTNTFLLGMSDILEDGHWLWDSDQTPVKWANWMTWKDHPDEPDGDVRESCALMMRNEKDYSIHKGYRSDGWADCPCNSTTELKIRPSSLICQKNKAKKCAGKKETYWPEKKDCRKFYFCNEKEEIIPMFCPRNLIFNTKTNYCDNSICYRDRIALAVGDSGTVLKTSFTLTFLTAMLSKVIAM